MALQIATSLETIAFWHHHVQQNYVRAFFINRFFDLSGIGNANGVKAALLQHVLHESNLGRRYFYNQFFLQLAPGSTIGPREGIATKQPPLTGNSRSASL